MCGWVCYHDNLTFDRPAPPGRGSVAGRKIFAPPYYSQSAVFPSPLSAFFIWNCCMTRTQLNHCSANSGPGSAVNYGVCVGGSSAPGHMSVHIPCVWRSQSSRSCIMNHSARHSPVISRHCCMMREQLNHCSTLKNILRQCVRPPHPSLHLRLNRRACSHMSVLSLSEGRTSSRSCIFYATNHSARYLPRLARHFCMTLMYAVQIGG